MRLNLCHPLAIHQRDPEVFLLAVWFLGGLEYQGQETIQIHETNGFLALPPKVAGWCWEGLSGIGWFFKVLGWSSSHLKGFVQSKSRLEKTTVWAVPRLWEGLGQTCRIGSNICRNRPGGLETAPIPPNEGQPFPKMA